MADSASGLHKSAENSEANSSSAKNPNRKIKCSQQTDRYSCDQCGYTAKSSSSLRWHIKSKYVGIRYHCDCDCENDNSLQEVNKCKICY